MIVLLDSSAGQAPAYAAIIGAGYDAAGAQVPFALAALVTEQVTAAGARALDDAPGGSMEPLGDRLSRFTFCLGHIALVSIRPARTNPYPGASQAGKRVVLR
jgi:hypothetical protein